MFEKNVFINCPYDDEYFELLRPIIFTILYMGYNPRLALETSDSGENRIELIYKLIYESKYSIHDLSRLQANQPKEFYRLNMPFELGIDFGCRRYSEIEVHKQKRSLILEASPYDYKKALSDISGMDIKIHHNDPVKAVNSVRNWFSETVGVKKPPAGSKIWNEFCYFYDDFQVKREEDGFSKEDVKEIPMLELMDYMGEWIEVEKANS